MVKEKRELDRREIERAINESGLVPKLKQEWAGRVEAQQAYDRVQRQRSQIRARVTKLSNAPDLLPLNQVDAQATLLLTARDGAPVGEKFDVGVAYQPIERVSPRATIRCYPVPDIARYTVEHVSPDAPTEIEVTASIDHCDVSDPRPATFLAADKGHPVKARVDSFDPNGYSSLTLMNTSEGYVTVSSFSLYYFDKIASREERVELPPASEKHVTVNTTLGVNSNTPQVTRASAPQKTFTFGIAVKYSTGDNASKTLLVLRHPTLKSALSGE